MEAKTENTSYNNNRIHMHMKLYMLDVSETERKKVNSLFNFDVMRRNNRKLCPP